MASAREAPILGLAVVALLGILAVRGRDVVTPSRPATGTRWVPPAPEILSSDVRGSGETPLDETTPEARGRTVREREVEWIVVTDEVGVPLPDAYLVLESGRIRRGDPTGRIRLPTLDCACHGPVWVLAPDREKLVLQDALDDSGRVVLRPAGAVEGLVVDHHGVGLPGARIDRDVGVVWDSHVLATTDEEGRFRVDHLPLGEKTRLRASGAGWVADSQQPFAAMEVSPGAPPVRLVRPGLGVLRLRFEWTPEGEDLWVQVVALDLVDETTCPLGPLGFDLRRRKVSDGVYEGTVPAGRLSLWILAPPASPRFFEDVVVETDRTTTLEIPRLPSGRLTGTIRDESGGPVVGASVRVAVPIFGSGLAMIDTDEEGRIRVGKPEFLPTGRVRLRVQAEGFVDHTTGPVDLSGDADLEVVLRREPPR